MQALQFVITCYIFGSTWISDTALAWTTAEIGKNTNIRPSQQWTTIRNAFDFSSPTEWDNYYKTEEETNLEHVEWHSSIPLETIASYVEKGSKCLIPGCGNSKLPETLLSMVPNVRISLQDSSPICLSQMEDKYGSSMEGYYCGDATKLQDQFPELEEKFDVIIDKGLSDALFCSEGWDGLVERLLRGASAILKEETGIYLLISYKLPKSTQNFLLEFGNEIGLDWTSFDIPTASNDRVSLSMAKKR